MSDSNVSVESELQGQHEERELAPSLLRRLEPGLRTDVFSLKFCLVSSLCLHFEKISVLLKRFFFVRENDNVLFTELQINVQLFVSFEYQRQAARPFFMIQLQSMAE